MLKVDDNIGICRPVGEVFAYYGDLTNLKEWGAGVIEVRPLVPAPFAGGPAYTYVRVLSGRRFEGTLKVTGYTPDQELVIEGTSNGTRWTSHATFKPVADDATEVLVQTEMELHGRARLLRPFIARTIHGIQRQDLANLKEKLEAR